MLANQKLCYVLMLLNIEKKSGEQDQDHSYECFVITDPAGLQWIHNCVWIAMDP